MHQSGRCTIKGPGFRIDLDVRRVWACPQCERRRKTPGEVTSLRCDCMAEGVWMQLVDEHPQSHRYQPYIVEEVEVDEAEFAGEPVVIPELPERPPDERHRHRPDRRRDDNGAASETEAPSVEPPAPEIAEPAIGELEALETAGADEADGFDEAPVETPVESLADALSEIDPATGNGQTKSDQPATESKPAAEGEPSRKPRKKRGGRRRGRRKGKSDDGT